MHFRVPYLVKKGSGGFRIDDDDEQRPNGHQRLGIKKIELAQFGPSLM